MEGWKNGRMDPGHPGPLLTWRAAVPCSRGSRTLSASVPGAEGPGALPVGIKTLIAVIDLEGCSPLQPREQNIVCIGFPAPRDRAPSRSGSELQSPH